MDINPEARHQEHLGRASHSSSMHTPSDLASGLTQRGHRDLAEKNRSLKDQGRIQKCCKSTKFVVFKLFLEIQQKFIDYLLRFVKIHQSKLTMEQEIARYIEECTPPAYAALMVKIVKAESSGNPFAIGVVGGRLARQPRNLMEAVATAKALAENGYNFSIGLTQVNKIHFEKLQWRNQISSGFDICKNITAGAHILNDCFSKAARYNLKTNKQNGKMPIERMALSCYYSGDLFLGERLGYVTNVLNKKQSNDSLTAAQFKLMDYSNEKQ